MGNEVQCEQIVWVPKRAGQSVPFNAYTIPIWWGAELKITAAEAEIYVSDREPYKGSSQYYQRLSKQYDACNLDVGVGENRRKSLLFQLYVSTCFEMEKESLNAFQFIILRNH